MDDNGALFLAAGYFKAEGIDRTMTTYECGRMVAEALASGTTDFALTGSAASNFAGKGTIKAIAARTREKRYYEGTELVGSNIGFSKGLQTFEDISARRSRSKRSARSLTVSWSRSHGSRKSA